MREDGLRDDSHQMPLAPTEEAPIRTGHRRVIHLDGSPHHRRRSSRDFEFGTRQITRRCGSHSPARSHHARSLRWLSVFGRLAPASLPIRPPPRKAEHQRHSPSHIQKEHGSTFFVIAESLTEQIVGKVRPSSCLISCRSRRIRPSDHVAPTSQPRHDPFHRPAQEFAVRSALARAGPAVLPLALTESCCFPSPLPSGFLGGLSGRQFERRSITEISTFTSHCLICPVDSG